MLVAKSAQIMGAVLCGVIAAHLYHIANAQEQLERAETRYLAGYDALDKTGATDPVFPGGADEGLPAPHNGSVEQTQESSFRQAEQRAQKFLESLDARDVYQKSYGPAPVVPLGVTEQEWMRHLVDGDVRGGRSGYLERAESAFLRSAARNRHSTNALLGRDFIAFGFQEGGAGGAMKIALGPAAGSADMAAGWYRERWAGARGHKWQTLPEASKGEFRKAYIDRAVEKRRTRSAVWTELTRVAGLNRSQGRFIRARAFLATHDGVFVFRAGESVEVDRLVRELERLRTEMRSRLRRLLK